MADTSELRPTIHQALKDGDVRVVKMTRSETRDFMDAIDVNNAKGDELFGELDNAQGDADAPGKAAYVLIEISGERL